MEEQAFKKYLKLLFVFVPILGLSLAIATYVTAKYVGGETIMQAVLALFGKKSRKRKPAPNLR